MSVERKSIFDLDPETAFKAVRLLRPDEKADPELQVLVNGKKCVIACPRWPAVISVGAETAEGVNNLSESALANSLVTRTINEKSADTGEPWSNARNCKPRAIGGKRGPGRYSGF